MFNHRYFGTRYFGDRYFPKHGATSVVYPPWKVDEATYFAPGAVEAATFQPGAVEHNVISS